VGTCDDLTVYITDVKTTNGLITPKRQSSFGLNRTRTFTENMRIARERVAEQVGDLELRDALLAAFEEKTYRVRIVGPPKVRISPRTRIRIEATTGVPVEVLNELRLP
jgi:hypothetical protein